MLATLLLASTLTLGPTMACVPAGGLPSDGSMQELYEGGRHFADFLHSAVRRKALWDGNYAKGAGIDESLVRRARAVGGPWRFLVVAMDSCSDSVSTIPYLARLVERVEGLDLRIIDSRRGRRIMEDHRTPDGRPSTPTVLLLDDEWNEVGCFIERPPTLRDWILENRESLDGEAIFERKMAWYAEDAGRETLETFVAMLEAATRGEESCGT